MTEPNFEAVWGSFPVPAMLIDPELQLVATNPAAESLIGLSERQVKGHKLEEFTGKASRVCDIVEQTFRDRVQVVQYDVEFGWQDHQIRLGTLQATPVGVNGSTVLLLMNPRGLAEKMDRSLGSRSAARSVTGMAAMLAHEIRNPIAGITGAAQLLSMNVSDEDRDLTRLIEDEVERIGNLVDRFENFGDLRPIVREPVNIHDVLNRAVISARAGFAHDIKIAEHYDPSLPPTSGDADQLMQVFQNLLKNAAEACPAVGGNISIHTAYRPGIRLALAGARAAGLPLEIRISDNGVGIPKDLIDDMFDPFVSTKVNGTGLGLSLVSKVLADHGGVIECDSEEGWTEFRMRLPVWDGDIKEGVA